MLRYLVLKEPRHQYSRRIFPAMPWVRAPNDGYFVFLGALTSLDPQDINKSNKNITSTSIIASCGVHYVVLRVLYTSVIQTRAVITGCAVARLRWRNFWVKIAVFSNSIREAAQHAILGVPKQIVAAIFFCRRLFIFCSVFFPVRRIYVGELFWGTCCAVHRRRKKINGNFPIHRGRQTNEKALFGIRRKCVCVMCHV